jgi:uncharacterized phage protein gp47/JayE
MAFQSKTISDLKRDAKAEVQSRLGVQNIIVNSVINVIINVWVVIVYGLYQSLSFLSRQLFWRTATGEYLTKIGESNGLDNADFLPATAANGYVRLVGAGAIVPSGTILQRDDGIQYQTMTDSIVVAPYSRIQVYCLTAGKTGNLEENSSLFASESIALLESIEVDAGGLGGGSDLETVEEYRERLRLWITGDRTFRNRDWWINKIKAYGSFINQVFVIRAEVVSGNYVPMKIIFTTTNPAIIPTLSDVSSVQSYVNNLGYDDVVVAVIQPAQKTINMSIAISPNTTAVQNAIREEIKDLFEREGVPGGTIPLSRITESISAAAGEYANQLISPTSDIILQASAGVYEVPVLGIITFSTKP